MNRAMPNESQVTALVSARPFTFLCAVDLVTIGNLFHMADDINRAVGDLVSVITEPQSSTTSSYYQPLID